MTFGHFLKWLDYHVILKAGGYMPPAWAYRMARIRAAYRYRSRHLVREAARRHLRLAFPERTDPELERMVRDFFISPCMDEQETFFQPRLTLTGIRHFVDLQGVDQIHRCLSRGKGAIVFSAHNASVCLFASIHGLLGFKTSAIVRPVDPVNDVLHPVVRTFAFKRQQWMEKILQRPYLSPGPGDLRKVIRCLEANEIVIALLDVPPELSRKKIAVDFFGKKCLFPAGIVRLAEETGCGLIFCRKEYHPGWNRLTLQWEEAIYSTGNLRADMQKCIGRMEDMVRHQPSQWYWWDCFPMLWAPEGPSDVDG